MEFLIAFVGIVGVAVGSALQHWSTQRIEEKRFLTQQRRDVYWRYVSAHGLFTIAEEDSDEQHRRWYELFERKTEMSLLASPEVLLKLEEFTMGTIGMFDLIEVMRRDVGLGAHDALTDTMHTVLMSKEALKR